MHSESSSLLLYPGVTKSYVRIITGNHQGGKKRVSGKNEFAKSHKTLGRTGLFFCFALCTIDALASDRGLSFIAQCQLHTANCDVVLGAQ